MSSFMSLYNGPLTGLMRWPQWDNLAAILNGENEDGWFVYYVGEEVPAVPLSGQQFERFMHEMDALLRSDHQEEYLGIVYADNIEQPAFVKIYDPNNLGSSCGSSGQRVLPGWTISRCEPVDLQAEFPNPGGRRRWWKGLFS